MPTIDTKCICCGETGEKPASVFRDVKLGKDGIHDIEIHVGFCEVCGNFSRFNLPNKAEHVQLHQSVYHYLHEASLSYADAEISDYIDQITSLMNLKKGTILEIGCGRGQIIKGFARRGFTCIANEASGYGDLENSFAGENIQIHSGMIEDLMLEPASMDLILAKAVLEHLTDISSFFEHARKALKPGGYLNIACIPAVFKESFEEDHLHLNDVLGGGLISMLHTWIPTPLSARQLGKRFGFEVVWEDTKHPISGRLNLLFKKGTTNGKPGAIKPSEYQTVCGLFEKYHQFEHRSLQTIADYLTRWKRNRVWCYGVGSLCVSLLKRLNEFGFVFEGLLDSNPEKQGLEIDGIKIERPEEADIRSTDKVLITVLLPVVEKEIEAGLRSRFEFDGGQISTLSWFLRRQAQN